MFKLLVGCFICLIPSVNPYSTDPGPGRIGGTASIGNNVYMLQTEVTVREWMEFIADNNFDLSLFPERTCLNNSWTRLIFDDLKSKGNFKHLIMTKSSIYRGGQISFQLKRDALSDSLKKTELAPLSLPITGITFDQAVKFCKWKEQVINIDRADSKKMQLKFNYKHTPCHDKDPRRSIPGQALLRVDSYWPTHLNLYGIQGNAAEMTASKGIAMGGSFNHYASQSVSSEVQSYSGPESWLGFRYIIIFFPEDPVSHPDK